MIPPRPLLRRSHQKSYESVPRQNQPVSEWNGDKREEPWRDVVVVQEELQTDMRAVALVWGFRVRASTFEMHRARSNMSSGVGPEKGSARRSHPPVTTRAATRTGLRMVE